VLRYVFNIVSPTDVHHWNPIHKPLQTQCCALRGILHFPFVCCKCLVFRSTSLSTLFLESWVYNNVEVVVKWVSTVLDVLVYSWLICQLSDEMKHHMLQIHHTTIYNEQGSFQSGRCRQQCLTKGNDFTKWNLIDWHVTFVVRSSLLIFQDWNSHL
jgi:hypothetical protein